MTIQDDATSHIGGQTVSEQRRRRQAEFLAKISHEIRTPLNAIMGYAEMLNKTSLDAKQQHFADNIVKSSLALVDILDSWMRQIKDPSAELILQAHPAAPAAVAPVRAHEHAPLKFLVVEDSSMIRDLFMDIFSEDHFAILTASTGAGALELAFAELPNLIFLDLHLPDTDGRQVAKFLRSDATTAAIPLIAMTGQSLKQEEYSPYFDDFLQKPFQLKHLRSMVDAWVHSLTKNRVTPEHAPPQKAGSGEGRGAQDFIACIRPYWNVQMSKLLAAISHTGSLDVTIDLGKCLQAVGQEQKCAPMEEAGRELVRCASIPDIAGLEDIITKLTSLLQAAHS
ncbi:MAG: response regulator [bacterium]|nr:response regulator [bacterium]